jgi:CRISPR-associated endoribonuclease Cas6
MRIQFSLTYQRGTIIPINYQSEVSNWIFTVLSKAGAELSSYVQQQGFDLVARNFKQFTFSPLAIYPYEMDQVRQEFKLMGNQVKIGVSIYLPHSFEQQVVSLFRQNPLQLGTLDGRVAQFEVKHWQIMPHPNFRETMQFKAVSPISVTNVDDEVPPTNNPYLMPESEPYDISFFTHIVRRFKAAFQYKSLNTMKLLDASYPMHYRLLGQAKSRLIHLKPMNPSDVTQLRGFVYDFEVSVPQPVLEYAYYGGFGEFPHLGFGYVDFREEGAPTPPRKK